MTRCSTNQPTRSGARPPGPSSCVTRTCSWSTRGLQATTSSPAAGSSRGSPRNRHWRRGLRGVCGRTVTRVGDVIVMAVETRRAHETGAIFRPSRPTTGARWARRSNCAFIATSSTWHSSPCWSASMRRSRSTNAAPASGSAQTWVARETQVLRALRHLREADHPGAARRGESASAEQAGLLSAGRLSRFPGNQVQRRNWGHCVEPSVASTKSRCAVLRQGRNASGRRSMRTTRSLRGSEPRGSPCWGAVGVQSRYSASVRLRTPARSRATASPRRSTRRRIRPVRSPGWRTATLAMVSSGR